MGTVTRSFNGTCTPVNYPCTLGSRYLDPCDCTRYFVCESSFSIIRVRCAPGTAFDHTSSTAYCRGEKEVILGGICDDTEPWDRCENALRNSVPTVTVDDVERYCKEGGHFTSPSPPHPQEKGADGGAIAGAIIAVLIVIALIVLLVIYIRRKGNPLKHLKETSFWRNIMERREGGGSPRSQQESPRYAGYPSAQDEEETYTEIDDSTMYRDPGSRKSSAAGRSRISSHTSSHTNPAYDKDDVEEGVSYDNPALRSPPDSARNPAPPAYSELDEEDGQEGQYTSKHKRPSLVMPRSESVSQPPEGEDGYLVANPLDQSARSESPDGGIYFEAEAENSC